MTNKEDEQFLALYSDSKYEKLSVTVDAVIFRITSVENDNYRKLPEKKLQVFLSKRKYPPFKDCYGVIGTFVDLSHELAETMRLCVKNKVSLNNFYFEQLFTFGDKARDPRTRVLSTSYLLLTNQNEQLKNGEWFDVKLTEKSSSLETQSNGYRICKTYTLVFSNENTSLSNEIQVVNEKFGLNEKKSVTITNNSLAFDHTSIIFYALERLKNKLEYTDIIFNLVPEEFTLTELKQCYELILHEHLLDANFRRKIAKMVSPTSKADTPKGHRVSQMFVHNPNWHSIDVD